MAKKQTIEITQERLEADSFKYRHRQSDKTFTRERRLPFALVVGLVMRNSVKSLQNIVNEAMTGGAATRDRQRLFAGAV